ncbi:hypothetical protein JW813_07565 [Clostridium botulinum]|uniref:hypothetical protein n=1 Tax=Clostridium botulinum TaxID=1491 RepID=UPI0022472DB2|nr:hypothetical protein [Clostridium botulinum]UZP04857.1 hypothetical protein JW813_07565 [Clostridium botulinum]UZP08268.1 hypothetical protein JYA71_07835 [Clostridium botulinum]UZP11596.1 hypothetical protein JYA74_07560 [Clostridium botulinum]
MNINKIARENNIQKKILKLEEEKQKIYELGIDCQERYERYLELDDKIDELMQQIL